MEGLYMNLRENIKEVWMLNFPEELFSTSIGNLVKTILCGIVIARGATVHASLASYLLIIYPVITERLRIMLVLWMVISGLRAILLNIVATCTGCVLCAAYPEIRPVCFEFAITKAVELACSFFMWVNVNDFYHALKGKQRHGAVNNDIQVCAPNSAGREDYDYEDSFDSYSLSLSESFLNRIKCPSLEANKDSASIDDSLIARTTIAWFIKKAFAAKKKQNLLIDDKKAMEMFLAMSVDDIIELQKKMRESIEKTGSAADEEEKQIEHKKSSLIGKNKSVDFQEEHLDFIDKIIADMMRTAITILANENCTNVNHAVCEKVLTSSSEKKDCATVSAENDITENLTENLSNRGSNDKFMRESSSCELFSRSKILGEIDETTIVRAIYERKNANGPSNYKPSKKIIWKMKE